MELYAAGFNAWGQLELSPPTDSPEELDDISSFQRVLTDKLIEVSYASLAYTIINTSAGLRYVGFVEESVVLGGLRDKLLLARAAVAGNGVIIVYDGLDTISQYASSSSFAEAGECQKFTGMKNIIQLAAYETGFVALSKDGRVWTWGDERYAASLGREITASSPADRPGLVEDLDGLPSGKIKKISAAGYTVLALTEGNDLYAWGGHPGRQPIIDSVSSSPSPVVVDENDILDCSVGVSHIIVMVSDGSVYVIGENTNGQLGLPLMNTMIWKKVPLTLQTGEAVTGVKAGPRSSFVITKHTHLA
ncbi:regulator of chromosome condensation 1/beta-lactamase-inhibitor protein II [Xylariaceae sp. FL1651]|nr:regulator of chromosome condensation 1/beta-lactamase-inhibitor protein II [Xylariaceae sp. FL1651]